MAEQLTPRMRSTEKTRKVVPGAAGQADDNGTKPPAPGHGRNGAGKFTGAHRVRVDYAERTVGCSCPECPKGKVYIQNEPRKLLRIMGMGPVQATVYELQRLRCNLCGQVFSADSPTGVGTEKYDETVPSMIAQLTYGSGVPFNRPAGLQQQMGIPLPASSQWKLVEEAAELLRCAGTNKEARRAPRCRRPS